MAKANRHGTSIKGVGPTQHGFPPAVKQALSRRPTIGGASPSVGNNSPESSESEEKKSTDETLSPQKPAQTMDSHSLQTSTESGSDANSTDGATRVTQNPRSARKSAPAKKSTPKKANVRSADGESDDEFDEPVDLSGSETDEFEN